MGVARSINDRRIPTDGLAACSASQIAMWKTNFPLLNIIIRSCYVHYCSRQVIKNYDAFCDMLQSRAWDSKQAQIEEKNINIFYMEWIRFSNAWKCIGLIMFDSCQKFWWAFGNFFNISIWEHLMIPVLKNRVRLV